MRDEPVPGGRELKLKLKEQLQVAPKPSRAARAPASQEPAVTSGIMSQVCTV